MTASTNRPIVDTGKCPLCRRDLGTGEWSGSPCFACRRLSRVRVRHITLHSQSVVDDLRRRVERAEGEKEKVE